MASNGTSKQPLTIVVGSDNAGHTMKTALKEVLSKHAGVAKVLDVGVNSADDGKAYPHSAVDAVKKIKSGEVGFHSLLHSCFWGCVGREVDSRIFGSKQEL
jgi:hypothetical protein